MDLTGRTALVTGASSGLGQEFAVQLAGCGANLVLAARRQARLEELRDQLLTRHPQLRIDVVPADLARPGSASVLADEIERLGRRVDVLVNNAGVGSHGKFAETPPGASVDMIQLNCVSLVELTARLLPPMLAAGRGLVLNLSSTAGFQPVPTMAVYAASKAFVLSFSDALWWETRSSGVRVLAVCPGGTQTEFFQRTGREFLTRGRQTPDEVVRTALAAVDRRGPDVVTGRMNRLRTLGGRILPRPLMPALAQRTVR